jgi:gamma-glutamylcyclotransferase (GGCT)/AIG2-like uncharacterized protein YtfP
MTDTLERRVRPSPEEAMYFFTYGIFLSASRRAGLGCKANSTYDVVHGYATKSVYKDSAIVEAFPLSGCTLTGLVVEITPAILRTLDRIEAGYDRIEVTTGYGKKAWMYVSKKKYDS